MKIIKIRFFFVDRCRYLQYGKNRKNTFARSDIYYVKNSTKHHCIYLFLYVTTKLSTNKYKNNML